jgi:hypothetical protein
MTQPHALAPLATALMGSRDPCLGEDSAAVNLLSVLQNWCSLISMGLATDSMGTSLWSLQAAIIDNSDILKNWEFTIPSMWLSGHRFNHMA